MLDFARVFPAEHAPNCSKELHGNFHLYQRLRPELVKKFPKPLNSDAFSTFSVDKEEREAGNALIEQATARMHELIEKLAETIVGMRAYELDNSAFNICNEMHRRGVRLSRSARLLNVHLLCF